MSRHVFAHEQLYVAISCVKSKKGMKVVCDADCKLSKTTTNAVYKEVHQGLYQGLRGMYKCIQYTYDIFYVIF